MDVDTLLSQADLPLTTTDTEAALAATVVRGRRRRRGRRLSVGCAAAAVLALVSGAAVSMDRGDRHQVVAGPPQSTTTADSGPAESARALSEQRQLEYPLSPDPSVAAVFAGNESAIIATVTSVGPVESVTAMPNLTYSYAAVGVTVDEVLFGDVSAGTGIVIRDLLGMSEDTASAYEIGGQYVFMLNPAVDVAGTGEMLTPNWAFPLVDDQLLWYDRDTGTDETFDLAEYRQLVAENQGTTPTAASVPSCAEVQPFLDLDSGIIYDYTASTGPMDLANRADVVVDGRLTGATTETGWVIFEIAVDEALKGDPGPNVSADRRIGVSTDGEAFVRLVPEGAAVIAFLFEGIEGPGPYELSGPEGFYIECPGTDTIDGDGPGWARVDELDDIVSALGS